MAGLKTLKDTAPEVAEAAAAADKSEAEGSPSTGFAQADRGAVPADPAPAIAALTAERDAALTRADKIETDYLVQSDKLAEVNAALEKAKNDNAEYATDTDKMRGTIAKLEAQIAALCAAPAPAPAPVDVSIKRPKVGKELKLPEEGKRAKAEAVHSVLAAGAQLVMVLADDNGKVQPYPAQVGGTNMFTAHGTGLLFAGAIDLAPERDAVEMRFAVLLDVDGKVLAACRLGAMLLGGGGLSAMIPGNNLRFEFD